MLIGEGFYKICFDTLLEGICFTDDRGNIIMNNVPFEEIFGYDKGELEQKNIASLIPEEFRKTHFKHLASFYRNPKKFKKGDGRDFYGLHKNGKIIHVEIGLSYFDYKGKTFVKALITDISYRKNREIKIKRLNLKLEKEVKRQTKELTGAVEELKKSNKRLKKEIQKTIKAENRANIAYKKEKELNLLQTKFLSLASHEFKTPLSGILTSVTLINKYNETYKNKNINNHIQTIKKLVYQLNSILDDFLFLEKTETKKIDYQFTTFQFCELIKKIINNTQSVLKKGQKIEFKPCKDNIIVIQDKKIVEIIFRNILYNAIKYSPVNSIVKIEIHTNKYVTVKIEDNGIGIPLDDQKLIFKRFFRAKNALHFQGVGIGLNIVKHHIEALGGSINFKSIENKKTTFTIRLPIKMEQQLNN